jgi:hypothetical protein
MILWLLRKHTQKFLEVKNHADSSLSTSAGEPIRVWTGMGGDKQAGVQLKNVEILSPSLAMFLRNLKLWQRVKRKNISFGKKWPKFSRRLLYSLLGLRRRRQVPSGGPCGGYIMAPMAYGSLNAPVCFAFTVEKVWVSAASTDNLNSI